jgi:hypothetical protein
MNIKKLTLVHAVLPNPLAHNRIDRRSEKNYSSWQSVGSLLETQHCKRCVTKPTECTELATRSNQWKTTLQSSEWFTLTTGSPEGRQGRLPSQPTSKKGKLARREPTRRCLRYHIHRGPSTGYMMSRTLWSCTHRSMRFLLGHDSGKPQPTTVGSKLRSPEILANSQSTSHRSLFSEQWALSCPGQHWAVIQMKSSQFARKLKPTSRFRVGVSP